MMLRILSIWCVSAPAWAQIPEAPIQIQPSGSVVENLFCGIGGTHRLPSSRQPAQPAQTEWTDSICPSNRFFGGRLIAAMAFLATFFLLLPESLRPAVPWVLIAAGVALGWSARDMLRDLLAAAVLLIERRIRPGVRIRTQDHQGVVIRTGFRAVYLASDEGGELGVPNRVFLTRAYDWMKTPACPLRFGFASKAH